MEQRFRDAPLRDAKEKYSVTLLSCAMELRRLSEAMWSSSVLNAVSYHVVAQNNAKAKNCITRLDEAPAKLPVVYHYEAKAKQPKSKHIRITTKE